MSNLLKKLTFSFLAALVLLFSFAPYLLVNAQGAPPPPEGTWYNQNFGDWYKKVYDESTSPGNEIFGERYTAAQVQWVIYGIFAFILNSTSNAETLSCILSNTVDLDTCKDAILGLISGTGKSGSYNSPSNESLASLVFADRSLSGISYIRGRLQNFSLVPEANAQTPGFGFTALEPIQDIWRVTRNVAFGLFVVVAIIFSFMIMFRVKINPQTVISVQSAIPKLIISLILVTFSYAIAGFLIDFMYVVIGIISVIMAPMVPKVSVAGLELSGGYTPADAFKIMTVGQMPGIPIPLGIFGLIILYLSPLIAILFALLFAFFILILAAGIGLIPVLIISILIIIVAIIGIWMWIKTVWKLFRAFANIILLTVFAPLQITIGTLVPSLSFGQWVKSFLGNLSVFIVTGALWLFAWIFMILAAYQLFFGGGTGLTTAGSSASPWPPLLSLSGGALGSAVVFAGASFVFFTLIPKATEVIQGFISGKPFAYGSAVGEALGPIIGPVTFGTDAIKGGVSKGIGEEFGVRTRAALRGLRPPSRESTTAQADARTGRPMPRGNS